MENNPKSIEIYQGIFKSKREGGSGVGANSTSCSQSMSFNQSLRVSARKLLSQCGSIRGEGSQTARVTTGNQCYFLIPRSAPVPVSQMIRRMHSLGARHPCGRRLSLLSLSTACSTSFRFPLLEREVHTRLGGRASALQEISHELLFPSALPAVCHNVLYSWF